MSRNLRSKGAVKGQTASISKLFAILSVVLDTSKDRQTNLVKFYLQTGFQVPSSEKVEIK